MAGAYNVSHEIRSQKANHRGNSYSHPYWPTLGLPSVGEGGVGKKADRAASWRMDPVGSAGMEEGSDQIGQEKWGKMGDKNCIRAGSMGAQCFVEPTEAALATHNAVSEDPRGIAMAMP
ncbi:uncharacterized protein N7446_011970 [Penicillium canescens]|uniref:uncharacterized protein n=1 Tax=Penicillium canescens TaxID=5083 RepID=UPI0026E0F40F|nr:uncharacterized protein N7446_011970 [Penicillium canescens]KAJ6047136.1 hypothetical protein N7446_011970 [Penicillium canescens]